MRMTTLRHPPETKLFVALVLAICLFAASVDAQPRFSGNFTLPYDVRWEQAVLPAGEYSITMDPLQSAALIRSKDGTAWFIHAGATEGSTRGNTCLVITVRVNERRVQSLNLPQLGQSVVYERLTKAERETLAKAVRTVPVIMAAK